MRIVTRVFLFLTLFFLSFGFAPCGTAAPSSEPCDLPQGLRELVAKRFPDRKVEAISDLNEDDKVFYKKDHGAGCPGLVRVNFYGDQRPTLALVLVGGTNSKTNAVLVVARQLDRDWETRVLETADGFPVVWKERPGKYEDVYKDKRLTAPNPVVVLCGYESWTILYAWDGKDVKKIWLSD